MKVKKLKFGAKGPSYQATFPFGDYEVWPGQCGRWDAYFVDELLGTAKTHADAEAICQEHFESAVKDCLEDE